VPYLTSIEIVTDGRVNIDRQMLSTVIAQSLSSVSGGRTLYVIAPEKNGRRDVGLKAIEPGEIAGHCADQAVALAGRYLLPVPLESNDQLVDKLRQYLGNMPKITRPPAESALKEALEEIVKLRAALGLREGEPR
jgi:hypothetical protein